ncbi:MAG: sigma-54-dependent Fis family transcriptional regulator [Polaromonas sp.]|nr:sigma-54-dependent Fis family transcriptional regulator [Polaromonas sp.]
MQTELSTGLAGTDQAGLLAVKEAIRQSHARSAALGLRAYESADIQPLRGASLKDKLERNQSLYRHARPVMETLYSQIVNTQSMVLLTDAQGVILHALGDDDFLAKADRVALCPGVAWSEQSKGTNAIGTALAMGAPMQVNADEHFLRANHFLTCSCSPILDPQGQVIGAIDVSGDHRSQSKHTMALVRMSAQMVENHLFSKVYEDAVTLRFHARPEFLGTLMEGLAAFSADGRFLSANRSGQFQLGLSLQALRAHTFSSLFGMDMATLLAHCRKTIADPLDLHLPGGVKVVAQAAFRARAAMLPVFDTVYAGHAAETAHAGGAARTAESGGADANARHAAAFTAQTPATTEGAIAPAGQASGMHAAGGLSSLRYLNTGDPQLAQVIERVKKVLGRDVAILITGETGTGKEWLAKAVHQDSARRADPFVAVNCASIPESLIESELFGYEDGAFTGARRKGSVGKVAQAHGGTLFLDEIGDMPLAMQARLLRVLQERSVVPLGSARQVPVDVAVVCATHRNLREMMTAGTFRDDLYYRLNGLVVRLPSLRERTDLDAIAARMLRRHAGSQPLALSEEVAALFRSHAWPGNLRQMATVLQTAALMAEGDASIRREHLPEDFLEDATAPVPTAAGGAVPVTLHDTTAGAIERMLALHAGNVSAAARSLGVSRNTIYRHLKATRQTH